MARFFLTTRMDETSPGRHRTDGPITRSGNRESRMDTLLATLQKDIKILCREGELVSEKMWQLYQTFEEVVYENTLSYQTSKIPEDVAEDGDSGVAMATEDTGEESLKSKQSLYRNRLAKNERLGIKSSEKTRDNHVPERAWYETEDDDENDGGETEGEEIMIRRCVRNGLTEEWVRYGHFQLTGKHYNPNDEKEQLRKEHGAETIQYDWESFTDEDDNVTLTYDWDADENNSVPRDEVSGQTPSQSLQQTIIERYRIEDHKVIPHTSQNYVASSSKENRDLNTKERQRHQHQKTHVPTMYHHPDSSRHLTSRQPQSQQGIHSVDPFILKRRKLYRKISSNIVDALTRQDLKQRKQHTKAASVERKCSKTDDHLVCTCPHSHSVGDVRATTTNCVQPKRQDKNNNNNYKNRNNRIITNGSLEQYPTKKVPVLRDNIVDVRVRGQVDPASGERPIFRTGFYKPQHAQSKLPKTVCDVDRAACNIRKFDHADIEYFTASDEDCFDNEFSRKVAGDRRPLIFYDIDKEFEEDTSQYSCTVNDEDSPTMNNNNHNRGFGLRHESNGHRESKSSDNLSNATITPETNVTSIIDDRRLTWDLGDKPLPIKDDAFGQYPLQDYRTPYQGTGHIGPSKKLFGDSSSKSVSNLSRCVQPGTRVTMLDGESENSNFSSRESLRLCGMRYAGFQAAWPSMNSIGNRRSFSGFTVIENPRDKRQWQTESDRLQPTYC